MIVWRCVIIYNAVWLPIWCKQLICRIFFNIVDGVARLLLKKIYIKMCSLKIIRGCGKYKIMI